MPKNLQSLLSSFQIDDQFQPEPSGSEVGGTGHQNKAYFALQDPYESLPLVLQASMVAKPTGNPFQTIHAKCQRVELPWDQIKRES